MNLSFNLLNATTYINSNIIVNSNVSYADDVVITEGITVTVQSDAILTIIGDLTIKPNAKLIVNNATIKCSERIFLEEGNPTFQNGAQLLANNALFTAYSERWRGIEVWGSEIEDYSAKLKFEETKLENAFTGIASYYYTGNFNPLDIDSNLTFPINDVGFSPSILDKEKRGGIVQVSNSNFINNNMHIDLTGRESTDVVINKPINGKSYIVNSSFTLDFPPYPISSVLYNPVELYPFVKVTDIGGVSILGCSFKDNFIHFTTGIVIDNSDVRIANGTQVLGNWGNLFLIGPSTTTFEGHEIGVEIESNTTFKRSIIENSVFNNMRFTAIQGNLSNNSIIVNNIINDARSFGIVMNFATDFEIVQNTIIQNRAVGININESGEDYNYIYKNKLINTSTALHFQGKNRSSFNNGSGLKFYCNQMNQNIYNYTHDVYVTINDGIHDGIASFQGDAVFTLPYSDTSIVESRSAGNRFFLSKIISENPLNIFNEGVALDFIYGYGNLYSDEKPEQYNIPLIATTYNHTCPDLYSVSSGIIKPNFNTFNSTLLNIEKGIEYLNSKNKLNLKDSIILEEHFVLQKQLVNKFIKGYLYANDSLVNYDSIALILDRVQFGWHYKVQLAQVLATQHKFEDAKTVLSSISINYSLSLLEQQDIDNLIDMYDVLEFLWLHNDDWLSVPSEMKANIDFILENGKGNYAYPLASYFVYRYKRIDPENSNMYNSHIIKPKENGNEKTKNNIDFRVYPNPANMTVSIEWMTKTENDIAKLTIKDILGNYKLSQHIKTGINDIHIEALNAGIYILEIEKANKRIYQQKLIKK